MQSMNLSKNHFLFSISSSSSTLRMRCGKDLFQKVMYVYFFQINCLNLITPIKPSQRQKTAMLVTCPQAQLMKPTLIQHPPSSTHAARRAASCAEFSCSHLNGPGSVFRMTITTSFMGMSLAPPDRGPCSEEPQGWFNTCCCLLEILEGAP